MAHKKFTNFKITLLKYTVFVAVLLLYSFSTEAKNYYFSSSSGNDAYTTTQAQSQSTPWKSISKLNSIFSTLLAGDAVYFKCGDVFYGSVIVTKSGSSTLPIIISSYGTGAKPLISGFTTLTSWSLVSAGIYQATATGISSTVNMVTLNSIPQAIGRYPNADAANGGYLNYETATSASITDNELTSATNWTGAELVVRKAKHVIEHWPIANHSGTTITYTPGTSQYVAANSNGYGYFFQRDIRCLDELGEWYYNKSTGYVQMYFGSANPSSSVVKVSTVDVLMNTGAYSNIAVSGLAFEGANTNAMMIGSTSTSTTNVTVQNCDFNYSGKDAIYTTHTNYPQITYNNINYSFSNAIEIENEGGIGSFPTVSHNTIRNTGDNAGMAVASGNSHQAITAYATDALIEYNTIDSVGYLGVAFYYNNAKVRYNLISNFELVKDDGGAIYTWTGPVGGPVYSGREIKNNIILNGIGAGAGTSTGLNVACGIYMDDGVVGVDISGNSIANVSEAGIYIHNTHEVNITNNTIYNCVNNQALFVHDNITPTDPIRNVVFKNNIMVAKTADQLAFNMRTIKDDINLTGTTDSNYYARPIDDGIIMGTTSSVLKNNYSTEGWKATFNTKDAHSKSTPRAIVSYKINSLNTGNLLTNGDFSSGISGITFWSQNSNNVAAWDATGLITSAGSLKISFPVSDPSYATLCIKAVGAVSSSKNYILRFTTLGTTPFGYLRAYLRQTGSPNAALTPTQIRSYGTSKIVHEFLFTAPTTEANASLVFSIQQNSGKTYIDDIQFYEANTTPVSIDGQLRFEYNSTTASKTVALGANYIGIDGTIYNGTLTLDPFTSKVLIKDTATVSKPGTPATLVATATAPAIACFGSSTTATVAATGGTAPYTGTGAFSVNAGAGTLKVAVPSPVGKTYTLLYSSVGAVSSAKTYILRFSTLGTTATGNLRASLRQTNTPWANITATQTKTFGTTRVDHEFMFTAPTTQTDASFLIEVLQTSGTVYIDNIAFFEATTAGSLISGNLYSYGQFESSISKITAWSATSNHTVSLDLTGKITNTYYYPVKDAAGTISTATATTSQPSAALAASVTSGKITVSGGFTTAVVAATGGTAPYTGTGSFSNVKVGTYNYTVTDAKGCTSVATLTLALTASRIASGGSVNGGQLGAASNATADGSKALSVNCYPNPTSTEFTLAVAGGSAEPVSITILSTDGKALSKIQGTSNKMYTVGGNLTSGMYIIQVLQGNTVQTLKAIKAK